MSGHVFAECRFAPCSQTERLIVAHGLETLYEGRLYRESWAPDCWLRRATPATVQLSHDGEVVGEVGVVIAHREWHIATLILEDLPIVRERFQPGARVSLQARALKSYENRDLRLVRHELARLDHIALVDEGQVPGYIGAKVTSLQEEPKPKPTAWRATVPAGWECLLERKEYQPRVGDELLAGRRVSHRFDGERFIAVG